MFKYFILVRIKIEYSNRIREIKKAISYDGFKLSFGIQDLVNDFHIYCVHSLLSFFQIKLYVVVLMNFIDKATLVNKDVFF